MRNIGEESKSGDFERWIKDFNGNTLNYQSYKAFADRVA
jgi:hypothetical protein